MDPRRKLVREALRCDLLFGAYISAGECSDTQFRGNVWQERIWNVACDSITIVFAMTQDDVRELMQHKLLSV